MKTNQIDRNHMVTKESLQAMGYEWAWIQSLDCVELAPLGDCKELDKDTLLEARFFNHEKELHLFWYEEELCMVETVREQGDELFEETQVLRGRFGKSITLRHFIGYEEDGQAYIVRSVLCDYEGGRIHG